MPYDYKRKTKNVSQLNDYMLARTLSMFEYTGLPETIPAKELERILQTKGAAFITEVNGKLYALSGSRGGEQDAYGNPQDFTVANVYLNFTKTLKIADDGVLMGNDDLFIGIMPLVEKANTMIVENEINMMVWGFNSRTQKLISAPDDKTKESAEAYLKKVVDGDLGVIGENAMFDGVKVQTGNGSNTASITEMTEYQQYIKATLFNELGISSNFNMKRERLVTGEVDQNEDSLFPYVYNMFQNRLDAVAKINAKYGTNITVDFGSVWKIKQVEIERGLDEQQSVDGSNSESGQSGDSVVHTERESETETVTEIIDDNEDGSGGKATETDTVNTPDADELQTIIDSEDASEEDKQAARELLAEMEGK